jgi:hypothetical protein
MNPLSILDLALSFSANTCFGLMASKWGEKRSGKLGVGSIVLGMAQLVLSIVLGATSGAQAGPPPLTKADLDQAMDKLRAELEDDLFTTDMNNHLAEMQALTVSYVTAYHGAIQDLKSRDTNDPVVDDILNRDWRAYYDSFKSEVTGDSHCVAVTFWAKNQPNRKYQTLDLYFMAAGLYMNLCQLCLIVEWNDIQADPKYEEQYGEQLKQFRKDYKQWQKDHAVWEAREKALARAAFAAANPGFGPTHAVGIIANDPGPIDAGPEPKRPERPKAPPEMFDQLYTSPFANLIRSNAEGFIDYAEAIVAGLERDIPRRDALAKKTGDVHVRSGAGPYKPTDLDAYDGRPPRDMSGSQVVDESTGEAFARQAPAVAAVQAEVLKGIEKAGMSVKGFASLKYVTDDKVKKFRETVENWKKTKMAYAIPT